MQTQTEINAVKLKGTLAGQHHQVHSLIEIRERTNFAQLSGEAAVEVLASGEAAAYVLGLAGMRLEHVVVDTATMQFMLDEVKPSTLLGEVKSLGEYYNCLAREAPKGAGRADGDFTRDWDMDSVSKNVMDMGQRGRSKDKQDIHVVKIGDYYISYRSEKTSSYDGRIG